MGKIVHVPMNGSLWKATESITITGTHTKTHAASLCAAVIGGLIATDGTYNREEPGITNTDSMYYIRKSKGNECTHTSYLQNTGKFNSQHLHCACIIIVNIT